MIRAHDCGRVKGWILYPETDKARAFLAVESARARDIGGLGVSPYKDGTAYHAPSTHAGAMSYQAWCAGITWELQL